MKKILTSLSLTILLGLCFTACSSKYDKYITEVKTGCLGGCFDVTIDEVLSQSLPNGKWNGGETDDEKIIVEYQGGLSGSEVRIQFTVENENAFKVSAIKGDNAQPQNAAEAAAIIESEYVQYYSYKYPDKAAVDLMPNESTENLLNGISAAYAEKAKNPLDIANYLDKTEKDIQTALGTNASDGVIENSEVSIMYNAEKAKADTVSIYGSRIYSLFGLQTYQPIDTVSSKIGDRFERVADEPKEEGKSDLTFIRNNSEDALIVTYDTNTACIIELNYIRDGLAGYRAEQERIKKETEAKAAAAAAEAKQVKSNNEAVAIVKAYVARQGYSDPYDMYEAHEDGNEYFVFAGHSYMGSDWIEDIFKVPKDNKNAVELVQ